MAAVRYDAIVRDLGPLDGGCMPILKAERRSGDGARFTRLLRPGR
jgi:hypothetical protein